MTQHQRNSFLQDQAEVCPDCGGHMSACGEIILDPFDDPEIFQIRVYGPDFALASAALERHYAGLNRKERRKLYRQTRRKRRF